MCINMSIKLDKFRGGMGMKRKEILEHVSRKPYMDEREEQIDYLSESDALDFSVTLCAALAVVMILCLKENPYDVFAIEFLTLAVKKHRDWKRMKRFRDIIEASVLWAFGITSLVFYLIVAIGKRMINEKEK